MKTNKLWETEIFQELEQGSLHPGGLSLTHRGLALVKKHRPKLSGLALDLGCGLGASLAILKAAGFQALGLDRKPVQSLAGQMLCADLLNLPLQKNCCSLILLECVLSTLSQPELGLKKIGQLLPRGGLCLLSDLSSNAESCRQLKSAKDPPSSCFSGALPKQNLEGLFAKANFQIIAFEDHSQALKSLAARLLWYGGKELQCFALGKLPQFSYGLWLLEKKEP